MCVSVCVCVCVCVCVRLHAHIIIIHVLYVLTDTIISILIVTQVTLEWNGS